MTTAEKIMIINRLSEIMLTHGAETYRVEDMMRRVANALNVKEFNSFVIPTGIFINYKDDNYAQQTRINRVYQKSINLDQIDKANDLARRVSDYSLENYDDISHSLDLMQDTIPKYSIKGKLLGSIAGGFFVLMFGGNLIECLVAYLISLILLIILSYLNVNFFLKHLIGGALVALLAMLSVFAIFHTGFILNQDVIIIGPIMLLVPGVAITVGVKDIISGELVSGSARITEALFTSIAIAVGVGMVLYAGF